MNNLIDERNERTRNRKKRKRKMDSIIGLSKEDKREFITLSSTIKLADSRIRLLDEGFCDNGFVIKKGTLEKFLNGKNEHIRGWENTENGWEQTEVLNLTDDFVGTVNLGHMDFATFPFIVGEWKKSDLTLVDIENDRKALDVDLRLDNESMFVRELARQPYDIGISAEFYYHINDEDTDSLSEMLGEWMPVIDEIFIFAYGLVGECGNVNSSGLELKGETMSEDKKELMAEEEVKDEAIEEKAEEVAEEPTEEVAELGVDEIDITITEEAEEPSEEAPEESDEEDEPEEEGSDEEGEVEEVADEDAGDDEDEVEEVELSYEEIIEEITTLRRENIELKDHIKALKEEKRGLKKKLQNEYDAKKDFLAKTANLSAELYPNEEEVAKEKEEEAKKLANERKYYKGDGIAD